MRTIKLTELNEYIETLDKLRGKLPNRKGGWIIGRGVFSSGYDLLNELLPNKSYFHVMVLNATGRMPDDDFCAWLEAIYICLSWPDPRIWCNTIGSLGATARASVLASTTAGLVASESRLYGPQTLVGGVEFIQSCHKRVSSGEPINEALHALVKKSRGKLHAPGYVRPIADGDDRVDIMLKYAEKIGFKMGKHIKLGLEIESYLIEDYGQSMNVGGYISAFLADQKFTSKEVYNLFPTMVSSGITACYVDDADKPAGHFLPLRCDDVEYDGPEERTLSIKYKKSSK